MPCINSAASQVLQYCTKISSFWRKPVRSQAQSRLRKKGFCRTCFHFCLLWKMWQHSLVLSTAKRSWQQKHLSDLLQMQRYMMHVLKLETCNPWVPVAAHLLAWERNWGAWQCSPFSKHDGQCTYCDVNCKHIAHFVLFVHLTPCCDAMLLKSFMGLGDN